MVWHVKVTRRALKGVDRLPTKRQKQARKIIAGLAKNPKPRGHGPVKGKDGYFRIWLGRYRIVYAINEDEHKVNVVRVDPRGDVYKNPEFH